MGWPGSWSGSRVVADSNQEDTKQKNLDLGLALRGLSPAPNQPLFEPAAKYCFGLLAAAITFQGGRR